MQARAPTRTTILFTFLCGRRMQKQNNGMVLDRGHGQPWMSSMQMRYGKDAVGARNFAEDAQRLETSTTSQNI